MTNKKLTGMDIVNTINIDIHSPVLPNGKMQIALVEKIALTIGKCNVKFYTERGNTFEIMVYNGDLQESRRFKRR